MSFFQIKNIGELIIIIIIFLVLCNDGLFIYFVLIFTVCTNTNFFTFLSGTFFAYLQLYTCIFFGKPSQLRFSFELQCYLNNSYIEFGLFNCWVIHLCFKLIQTVIYTYLWQTLTVVN